MAEAVVGVSVKLRLPIIQHAAHMAGLVDRADLVGNDLARVIEPDAPFERFLGALQNAGG